MLAPLAWDRAGRLAGWVSAGLQGVEPLPAAVRGAADPTELHTFDLGSLGSVIDGDTRPADNFGGDVATSTADNIEALIDWCRRRTVGAVWVVTGMPGDAADLPGPPRFNEEVIEAGAAVLLGRQGMALVPTVTRHGSTHDHVLAVHWTGTTCDPAPIVDAARPPGLSVAEADQRLLSALHQATDAFNTLADDGQLGSAAARSRTAWRATSGDDHRTVRAPTEQANLLLAIAPMPAGTPQRVEGLRKRALHTLLTLVHAADATTPLTTATATLRLAALHREVAQLGPAARAAHAAAWNWVGIGSVTRP